MLKELIKVANSLDDKGFHKEADALDEIINNLGDFSDLDDTNITKDEAFQAGVAVCDTEEEESLDEIIREAAKRPWDWSKMPNPDHPPIYKSGPNKGKPCVPCNKTQPGWKQDEGKNLACPQGWDLATIQGQIYCVKAKTPAEREAVRKRKEIEDNMTDAEYNAYEAKRKAGLFAYNAKGDAEFAAYQKQQRRQE